MKNVFKVVLFIVLISIASSCNRSDDPVATPIRDYATQYAADLAAIQTYLKTHKLPAGLNPNTMQHINFDVVPELDPTSIWGSNATTPNSNVLQLQVEKDDITYTIYYLQMQQGTATISKNPCNLDGVLSAYEGQLLDGTVFDSNFYPQSYLNLGGTIRGWSELFPKFKSGGYSSNPDGSITYSNFGAGIMFLPSGLGYYSSSAATIPAYSPLIFSFKLYEVQRVDNDGDGIPSYFEDRGSSTGTTPDGYIRDNDTTYEDDTDHDGTPDALDVDDDGDAILTKEEIKYIVAGNTYYYPYNGAVVDDPTTLLIDESKGIPSCGTSPDYTTPTRLRKHLDASCH